MTPIADQSAPNSHTVKDVAESILVKQLLNNVKHAMDTFKVEAFHDGRAIPEALALVLTGEREIIQEAASRVRQFCEKQLPLTVADNLSGRLLCTISARVKKLEEIEEAERRVVRLKAELEEIKEDN